MGEWVIGKQQCRRECWCSPQTQHAGHPGGICWYKQPAGHARTPCPAPGTLWRRAGGSAPTGLPASRLGQEGEAGEGNCSPGAHTAGHCGPAWVWLAARDPPVVPWRTHRWCTPQTWCAAQGCGRGGVQPTISRGGGSPRAAVRRRGPQGGGAPPCAAEPTAAHSCPAPARAGPLAPGLPPCDSWGPAGARARRTSPPPPRRRSQTARS